MTILAYILIILPISPLVVTLGVGVGVFALALPLFWLPGKNGAWVRGFLAGLVGELAGFGYGYLIFRLLVGAGSFTIVPACVAAIMLLLPPINDLRHARKVDAGTGAISDYKEVQVTLGAKWGAGIGEAVGIPVGIVLFGMVL
jgi:hypothetical protein